MIQHEIQQVPVTALAFSEDFLFAGEGPSLKIYSRSDQQLLTIINVFKSQAIHGITTFQNGILVWGGRLVATYNVLTSKSLPKLEKISCLEAIDWILDISVSPWGQNELQTAAVVTAHNALHILQLDESGAADLRELTSNSKCILYSAHIHWASQDHILIASGTVFGEIIVWSCRLSQESSPSSTLHHLLTGHEGSIFGVHIFDCPTSLVNHGPTRLLASCSDDRTIRIWDISELSDMEVNPQNAADLSTTKDTGFGANIADVLPGKAVGGKCLARGWGHTSRIWGVRFVAHPSSQDLLYLVSFGEDTTCQYWSLESRGRSETGHAEYSLEHLSTSAVHSGKHIWSWAITQGQPTDIVVATGGADGNIVLEPKSIPLAAENDPIQTWPIEVLLDDCPEVDRTDRADNLRGYTFMGQNDLLITTNAGNVVLLRQAENGSARLQYISKEVSLRGYSVTASIEDLSLAFMSGTDGSVLLYDGSMIHRLAQSKGKTAALFAQNLSSSKQHVQQASLVVTNVQARTAMFLVFDAPSSEPSSGIQNLSQWSLSLPPSFIVTSALAVRSNGRFMIIIGSRSGSIAVYLVGEAGKNEVSVSVKHDILLQHVHGRDAVTDLSWTADSGLDIERGHVFSVGRDGTYAIHRYVNLESKPCVQLINQTSLLPGTNIEGLYIDPVTSHVLVWGFYSKQFFVFNATTEENIMTVDCGGASKSWTFKPLPNLQGGYFAWTRTSQLCLAAQTKRPRRSLSGGGHGREIKCVAVSPKNPLGKDTLFATGAEDTDIKLFVRKMGNGQPHFSCLRTLRKHNTGLRHLEWSHDGRYLFSSGGFEEFFVWRIEAAPLIGLGVVCESVCPTESDLPDLRIMGFSVIREDHEGRFIISMVRSDSTLRVYHYTSGLDSKWQILMVGNYLTSCLTNCLHLREETLAETLVTSSTDGHVAFWPIDRARFGVDFTASVEPTSLNWVKRHKIHQNTIHTMQVHWIADDVCLLLTGGDDNAIAFSICSWGATTANVPEISTLIIPRAHTAAVTGLEIVGSSTKTSMIVASSSIDQRVKMWGLQVDLQSPGVEGLKVTKMENKFTAVADVSSLAPLDGSSFIICGVGMDVLAH